MPSLKERARRFWARHRTFFWILHSVWALATGVVVIVLARERYGFLPWVVAFMGLTWISTLFFGWRTAEEASRPSGADHGAGTEEMVEGSGAEAEADDATDEIPEAPGLLEEVTSYMTRIMYQETLFFLLPFYAYSTVLESPNVVFVVLIGVLAVVSCLDLVFDRWLRASPVFGLVFFATVAFTGVNLVLPMLWKLPPRVATPTAAAVAVVAALVLGLRTTPGWPARLRLAAGGGAFLTLMVLFPALVPPVPLRLESAVFTSAIDRGSLTPADTLADGVPPSELPEGLVVLVRVFAPSSLPSTVSVAWEREGTTLRTSREIEVVAHQEGFRIWDALRPAQHRVAPGRYQVVLRTGPRVFGMAEIEVGSGGDARRAPGPRLAVGGGAARP